MITNENEKELAIDEIKRLCQEAGISLRELCTRKNIDPTSLQRWKGKDPKSIQTYRDLKEGIEEYKTEKTNG